MVNPGFNPNVAKAGDHQQFVHILGPAAAGMPPGMLWEAPTENDDISFLTFP
jgi:hypothetical protein